MNRLTRATICLCFLGVMVGCNDDDGQLAPEDGGTTGGADATGADTAPAPVYENCFNGEDDNGDRLVDCADPECRRLDFCTVFTCPDGDIGDAIGFPVFAASTLAAGNEQAGSCGGQGGADLALTWTAPADGRYFIDTLWGSYDTVLYVLDGCEGEELACNDDSETPRALQSSVEVDVEAGDELLIVVDGYEIVGAESGGDFVINITPVELPSEDGFCLDRRDNDDDGAIDCMDEECQAIGVCAPVVGAESIELGANHSCAFRDGELLCWGGGGNGQLGDGESRSSTRPVVAGSDHTFVDFGLGDAFTCGLTEEGDVLCWGGGNFNVLLLGWGVSSAVPVEIPLAAPATAIAVGGRHACAILDDERVSCWGSGDTGQLGHGAHETPEAPVFAEGLDDVATIAAGGGHTCAITDRGALFCWGLNNGGQAGTGDGEWSVPEPAPVRDIAAVSAVALGTAHSCAITNHGELLCWGQNWNGQVGNGTTQGQITRPSLVDAEMEFTAVAAGANHSCAVADGEVFCWGYNGSGQLGTGDNQIRPRPTLTGPEASVTSVGAGHEHACAVDEDGHVWCWGGNRVGQLGDGTRDNRLEPVLVLDALD